MKTNRYLLPTCFKVIGWLISIPSACVLLIYLFGTPWGVRPAQPFRLLNETWLNVLNIFGGDALFASACMVLLVAGLLFIAFSKEKIEDEYIAKLRGDSLIWAVIVNAILMAILSVTVFGGWFLFASFANFYTTLVLFIIKFNVALKCLKKESRNEE